MRPIIFPGDRVDHMHHSSAPGIVVAVCDDPADDVIVWRRDSDGLFESWFATDLRVVQRFAEPGMND